VRLDAQVPIGKGQSFRYLTLQVVLIGRIRSWRPHNADEPRTEGLPSLVRKQVFLVGKELEPRPTHENWSVIRVSSWNGKVPTI